MSNKTSILYQQKWTKHHLFMLLPPPTPCAITLFYQINDFFFYNIFSGLFLLSPHAWMIYLLRLIVLKWVPTDYVYFTYFTVSLSCQLRACGPVLEVILFQSPRDVMVLHHTWTGTLSSICYVVVDIHPSSPSRTSVFSEVLGTLPIVVASLSTTTTALKMAWLASSQFFLSSFYSGFSLFWQFWM